MFVDDLVSGGELTEELRFMEIRDKATRKRNSTQVQSLDNGGLYFNSMQKKGEQVNEQQQLLGGSILGSSERDRVVFQLAINVSQ